MLIPCSSQVEIGGAEAPLSERELRDKEVAAYARKHKWTKRPWQPPCHAADYYC